MLDELTTLAARGGAKEVVLGMAHRGRLSVLAHTVRRPAEAIFAEFEGGKRIEDVKAVAAIPHGGTGDVSTTTATKAWPSITTAARSRSTSTRIRATSSSSTRSSPARPVTAGRDRRQ